MPDDGLKRYLVGANPNVPGSSIGMCLEGEEDAVLNRILGLIKQGPAICWTVTTESPFSHEKVGK